MDNLFRREIFICFNFDDLRKISGKRRECGTSFEKGTGK